MLQLIRDITRNPSDTTEISLIFANVTEDDILLKDEIDAYVQSNPRIKVYYTLDKPSPTWNGLKGFVTTGMIEQYLPPPGPDSIILLCGPKPMMDGMEKNLIHLGYKEEQYFKY
jgi:cytochrome-b5 reductase